MTDKIMIVEDDTDLNQLLTDILTDANYQTIQAYSGTEAMLLLQMERPDLMLLDLMLPGKSGEVVLHEIYESDHVNLPVLVISAKTSVQDKVSLLNYGADDYITKPFEPEEIVARVQANLRRSHISQSITDVLSHKQLMLNPDARTASLCNQELSLTVHEFDILSLLMQHPQKVYSRETLYEIIWQGGYYGENNTVNVHVSNIRRKMKKLDPTNEYIKTVYGIGFKLSE